jgi:hypothetical protein
MKASDGRISPVVRIAAASLCIGAVTNPTGASAQNLRADGRTAYPAAHYTPFAPQTALDMVRRTPGFVLDEGDDELRGFRAVEVPE